MEDQTQKDIRSLLKTFGIQADEAINEHLARVTELVRRNPSLPPLTLRITLEDLTDYGAQGPDTPLMLEVEGMIRHS